MRDPLQRHGRSTGMLREAFGLTLAEASLAQALISGVAAADHARRTGVSLNTVYTHLRHLKEKTQTRRQAELIRRLNDLNPPLRDG